MNSGVRITWRQVSHTVNQQGFLWQKKRRVPGSKVARKAESKIILMADELVSGEKLDEQTRAIMKKGLKHIRRVRDEEKAAKELLEEVQERRLQMEDEIWQELDNYIFSWEPGKRRSGSLTAKIWQLALSSNTKAENLEHDFNEIDVKIRELGWGDGKRVTRSWVEKEEEENP